VSSTKSRKKKGTEGGEEIQMGRNIITKTFNCESCGHVWRPALWLLPKTCPKCHNPDWDTPRRWHEK